MTAKWPTSVATDADLYVAKNALATTLASTITDIVTTIPLTNTTNFPVAGAVTIGQEIVFYTGISGSDLTGCVRGSDGTINAGHNSGVPVSATVVAFHHNGLMAEIEAIETYLNSLVLDNLTDVVITTPAAGQILSYNGVEWINSPAVNTSGGSGISLFMSDVASVDGQFSLGNFPDLTLATDSVSVTSATSPLIMEGYITSGLARTQLDSGLWSIDLFRAVTAGGVTGTQTIEIEFLRRFLGAGTVTTTGGPGAGPRTCTVTGGTPFINPTDGNANITLASHVETASGVFPITAVTSTSVVTIQVPASYSNEAGVAYHVQRRLFNLSTGDINDTVITQQTIDSVQPAYTGFAVADELSVRFFATTSTGTRTVAFTHGGSTQYSHIHTPLVTTHNSLANLDGGVAGQYYHLTTAQHAIATQIASASLAGYVSTGSQTFAGAKTFNNDVTLAAGKNVVLTDDTTNTLTLALPAAVTSYTLTLPTTAGTLDYVLTTDGNGVTTWAKAAAGADIVRENYIVGTPSGNYSGSTTVFDLVKNFIVGGGSLVVLLDGVVQTVGGSNDYVETDSNTVTFNNALVAGQKVGFMFSIPVSTSGTNFFMEEYDVGTALNNYTGSTTVFDLNGTYTQANNSMSVFVDGVRQRLGATYDYVETSGTRITFNAALTAVQNVTFFWFNTTTGVDYASKSLDNLSATAINTSLISDTNNTDDLGSSPKKWKDIFYAGTLTGAAATLSGTVDVTGQLKGKGTATNDSAASGYIGEYTESVIGNTNMPTTTTFGDLTSISLTAGDWDVSCAAIFVKNLATSWGVNYLGVTATAGNSSTGVVYGSNMVFMDVPVANLYEALSLSSIRVSISTTTTYYLKTYGVYSGGQEIVYGARISARRVR